ncbi:hypothetical protein GCM10007416_11890 [Kroppenstedtia guangzhouensis]|uniref:Uncharacterized protein n=1 Tax=Kroppenstedtia guangzhouensis TaxID=1274356 RepID=A0ABQ1GBN8_9BACL|nr:hypothetical protein GCM10007416_11890 [Kroppenstedtia guangzhouensis]
MNERLKKKLHKIYLYDLVYELSNSDAWRKKWIRLHIGIKFISVNLAMEIYRIFKKKDGPS